MVRVVAVLVMTFNRKISLCCLPETSKFSGWSQGCSRSPLQS